jgi:hypothetical protein
MTIGINVMAVLSRHLEGGDNPAFFLFFIMAPKVPTKINRPRKGRFIECKVGIREGGSLP